MTKFITAANKLIFHLGQKLSLLRHSQYELAGIMGTTNYSGDFRILLIGASGYLGSRFAHDIGKAGWNLDGCDLNSPSEKTTYQRFFKIDFAELDQNMLAEYSAVMWFAGHSTVPKCIEDPAGSVENNVVNLLRLAQTLHSAGIPLIYASTASMYSSATNEFSLVADERRANIYDSGKLSFDVMCNSLGYKAIGLRLATVAGWSPQIRWETIFNAMNLSAHENGQVRVTNASNFRGLVFMDELSSYVLNLLDSIRLKKSMAAPTQIPISCWSGSIGSLGAEVAAFWQVPLKFGPDSGTYSFVLTDQPLSTTVANPTRFYRSISERCRDFAMDMNWQLPSEEMEKIDGK